MQKARNHEFDMVKVVAMFFILFHHYQQTATMVTGVNISGVHFYDDAFQPGDFSWGYIVELFFILSGFFMLSYGGKIRDGMTFYQFYTHRAARILPLMAVSGVVCACMQILYDHAYRVSFWDKDPSIFGVVLQALGIQSGWAFQTPALNSSTWYCSVLMLCYLIFYAIEYWSNRLNITSSYGFAGMILLGCSIQSYRIDMPFLNEATGRGYSAFFFGVLFAKLMPLLKKSRGTLWLSVAVPVIYALVYYKKEGSLQYMPFLLTFVLYPAILMLVQYLPFSLVSRLPFWGDWVKIGYSVFIWHIPCYIFLYSVVKFLGMEPTVLVNIPMMLLCAVAMQFIGWLSYHFLEQPLNKKASEMFASLDSIKQPKHV